MFPYEHNFCVTFFNEFLSIVKWLRLIHKKQNIIYSSNLPSDIMLKVFEFLFSNFIIINSKLNLLLFFIIFMLLD